MKGAWWDSIGSGSTVRRTDALLSLIFLSFPRLCLLYVIRYLSHTEPQVSEKGVRGREWKGTREKSAFAHVYSFSALHYFRFFSFTHITLLVISERSEGVSAMDENK